MKLLILASGDSWPQEKFEGHGVLGFVIFVACVVLIYAIATDGGDD